MPGIFGIVNKHPANTTKPAIDTEMLKRMAATMQYEDFYTVKLAIYPSLGVQVGWVGCTERESLSAWTDANEKGIDLFLSGMAICDLTHSSSSQHQTRHGGSFEISRCCTQGESSFVEEMDGLFAGFLIDKGLQQCILFNDRYGGERVFYFEDENRFIFSSEAKAILAVVPGTRSFDLQGLAEFLTCGCSLAENSLFRGIRILPGGSKVTFSKQGRIHISRYFDRKTWEDLEPSSDKGLLDRICESWKLAVRRWLSYPLPMGLSLTGGLDSRMVIACVEGHDPRIPCYSFGSMYRDSYDVLVARSIAHHCQHPYHILVLGEEFLSGFENYLRRSVFISDGYLGLSGAAELCLNALARQIAPVRITGNCGGELLRGVRSLSCTIPRGNFIRPDFLSYMRESVDGFAALNSINPLSLTLFHLLPAGYGRYSIERSQVSVFSPFVSNSLVKLLYQIPREWRSPGSDLSVSVIEQLRDDLLDIPTDRGLLGTGNTMTKLTRRAYREALFKVEYWVNHGMPSSLVAISHPGIDRLLEKSFLGRHKFQHFRVWTQHYLSDYLAEILLQEDGRLGEFFDLCQVHDMVRGHLTGKRNYTDEIDKFLTLTLTIANLFEAA